MSIEDNTVTIALGELRPTCFVIMPFAPVYQSTYERVMRPAIEEAGLECIRGDEVFTIAQITHEIWKQIRECRLVVAELTGKNPNVLYELGLAHALGKPAIIITRFEDDVPFDLKALRYLYYDVNDPFWGDTLRQQLSEMCRRATKEKQYNSIFDGISLSGELSIPTAKPIQRNVAPEINISGVWSGTFYFDSQDIEHSWNLHLVQNKDVLNGSVVVSLGSDGELTVVQESISGGIDGDKVSFHGTSYSYLQRGTSITYSSDNFEGKVNKEGDKMSGRVSDETSSGKLILSRNEA